MKRAASIFLLLILAISFDYSRLAAGGGNDAEKGYRFKPEVFESHLRFLSDDLLEGRGIATRGGALARLYIETVFRNAGLKGGVGGSYMQKFGMTRYLPDVNARLSARKGEQVVNLTFGDDFVCTNYGMESGTWQGELVFIGYGIYSPSEGWDFFKGADLKGKMLIGFTNEPGRDDPAVFKGKALTWFGRWVYKYEEAARRGAAGLIIIHNDADAGYSWDVVRNSWSGDTFKLTDDKNILPFQLWMTEGRAREIIALAGYELNDLRAMAEKKTFKPLNIPVNVNLESKRDASAANGVNVIGILPGTDERLKDKAIVLTAHYDHFGRGREINGDDIYNGAVDNGTALSVLLGLAQAYGSGMVRSKATLVFAAVDAEEEGMLGSAYYTMNPAVHLKDTIANINFEMANAWGRTRDIVAIGADKSDLVDLVKLIARKYSLTISPDAVPEQGYFYRSDQLSFARAGVPSVWLDGGYNYINKPESFGLEIRSSYRLNDYHKPTDEIKPSFDFDGLSQIAEWAVSLIREIEKTGWVNWNPDSEFKRTVQ